MLVFDRSWTHACLYKSTRGVYRCQMALQSTAWEMIDVNVQWLMEIRRTLQCLGWRMLTVARPMEPFDMAIGAKPKRDLESCMKVLLEPVTKIVTGVLFPFALHTALGSTLGMVSTFCMCMHI